MATRPGFRDTLPKSEVVTETVFSVRTVRIATTDNGTTSLRAEYTNYTNAASDLSIGVETEDGNRETKNIINTRESVASELNARIIANIIAQQQNLSASELIFATRERFSPRSNTRLRTQYFTTSIFMTRYL